MPARLYGAAAEFAERKYGGGMAEREATFTATTSVQQVFGNDPERVSVLIVNTSTNSVYIGFSEAVSATNGLLLSANGGSFQSDVEEDLMLPIRAVYCLAAGAGSGLYVLTARRYTKTNGNGVRDAN